MTSHDIRIIRKIEKILGTQLPKVEVLWSERFGYVTDGWQNKVTGLCLSKSGLGKLSVNFSFFKNLDKLHDLYIDNNQLSDISFLENLTQLQRLYLSNNNLIDISSLKELSHLRVIDLSANNISDIFAIKDLKMLQEIDLRDNLISSLPYWITELPLEIVNLSH